jgi:hypothetical protein
MTVPQDVPFCVLLGAASGGRPDRAWGVFAIGFVPLSAALCTGWPEWSWLGRLPGGRADLGVTLALALEACGFAAGLALARQGRAAPAMAVGALGYVLPLLLPEVWRLPDGRPILGQPWLLGTLAAGAGALLVAWSRARRLS